MSHRILKNYVMFHVEQLFGDMKNVQSVWVIVGFIFLLINCKDGLHTREVQSKSNSPNIVWIVAEDLSPVIPSFGDSTIVTKNLSSLAREGVCYDRFFSPSGVCSPSRAAITTGMYPIEIGANHMRTGPWFPGIPQEFIDSYAKNAMPPNIKPYECVPPVGVKMMSEYLRQAGYYCTNNSKEDYQFVKSLMAWDDSSTKAHWRNGPKHQPFFSVFNLGVTHESQIWSKATDSLWVDEELEVPVPPYLPTTDSALIDIRRMYSNIKVMDSQVGRIINELKEDGLLDNTIIFWYTDHGGPLPRQKRLTYDSGLKVPLIIRFPDKHKAGTRSNEMLSFIDLAPTVLSLANIKPPDIISGRAFLGKYKETVSRKYIYAASDRFDETDPDPIRAVRDDRYKYIRYYSVDKPMFYHVGYRDQMPIMRELYKLREAGLLNEQQALWFRKTKPKEEFFDTYTDHHEVNNLAENPEYLAEKTRLSIELENWLESLEDLNMIDEKTMVESFWPEGSRPTTSPPTIEMSDHIVKITTETEGASIGYRIVTGVDTADFWKVYSDPFQVNDGDRIVSVSHRLGYYPSPQITSEIFRSE